MTDRRRRPLRSGETVALYAPLEVSPHSFIPAGCRGQVSGRHRHKVLVFFDKAHGYWLAPHKFRRIERNTHD